MFFPSFYVRHDRSALGTPGRLHHMADEHAGGDGAHAAGDRGDGIYNGLHLVKDRVAGNGALAALARWVSPRPS